MALVKCEEEKIHAIAEAIRLNPNFTDTYNTNEMAKVIAECINDYRLMFSQLLENSNKFDNVILYQLLNGIAKIGPSAFEERAQIHLTQLPDSIENIGERAFYYCSNLELTFLPPNLKSIGNQAFGFCNKLALTELPANLTEIGSNIFFGCTNLKSLTFKGKPNIIDSSAFNNCSNLITINVPWSEGEVANAPWGATNATINYNF